MGFRCGIVGLPNVGKSTLFNALTETAAAQAANYPFCTIEPNVGRVAVPDLRLDKIREIAGSAQEIETQIEFVDIAGLVRGASKPARLVQAKDGEEAKALQRAQLLTAKPVLYVCNVDEGEAATGNALSEQVFERAGSEGAEAVVISAAIEAEIATLPAEERN